MSEARNAPGVVDVVTAADVNLDPYPAPSPAFDAAIVRPMLATDRVRFVGEPVAVVVADTPAAAIDAAEMVVVDYESLPAIVDPEAALDGPALFEGMAEPNVVVRMSLENSEADFEGCEAVVEVRTVNNRIAPCPLEPRVAASRWADDGRLHHVNAGQGPHPVRAGLAKILDLDRSQMRVLSRDVGGSFGAKARPHPEEALLGWLAARVGRPVMWVPSRTDDMVGLVHGRGQIQYCRIGGTREGRITAFHVHVVQQAGAYGNMGAALPNNGKAMLAGCYDIATLGFTSVSVLTNTTPTGPYRGAGRPKPPRRSSAPSTPSPPRSAWILPRCAGRTSCSPKSSRSRPAPACPTTRARTRPAWTQHFRRPTTAPCVLSRRVAAPTATSGCSASVSPPMWSARRAWDGPSTGRWNSSRAAASWPARGRRPTGRATTPHGRC